jgi:hypothetical protein
VATASPPDALPLVRSGDLAGLLALLAVFLEFKHSTGYENSPSALAIFCFALIPMR